MFSHLLGSYRVNNNLTQQQFIDELMYSYSDFHKLDSVTLSRWENNKTKPSLKKQIMIVDTINETNNYINSICTMDNNKIFDSFKENKFNNDQVIISNILSEKNNNIDITHKIGFINDNVHLKNYLVDSELLKESCNIVEYRINGQVQAILIYKEYKNNLTFVFISETLKSFEVLFHEIFSRIINKKFNDITIYTFDKHNTKLWKSTENTKITRKKISSSLIRDELTIARLDLLSNKYLIDIYVTIKNFINKNA